MAGIAGALAQAGRSQQTSRPPNLVLILTDNHGAWTLGCYGNPDVRTPHIDRLAREGMLFTRAFAVNAVCSPTRASLLTGLMPCQHGVHRYLAAGGAQIGPGAYNTIGEFASLPVILAQNGYVAGLTGKWHLGANLTPQSAFTYWVTKPHGGSAGFYDQEIIENGKVRVEPTYLTQFWTDHAIRFIEQNRRRPFFLFLTYNGPYGLGSSMKESVRNRHAAYYADKELPSFPRDHPHPWEFNFRDWTRDVQVRRKYAAEVSGIDDGVGRILDTLTQHGLDRDTLVVFTADQGLAGGQSGFWGMGDHTRPLTAFDWTTWVPLIFRHPGRIAAGQRNERMVDTCDILPTVLDHLALAPKIPQTPALPGKSFAAMLQNRPLTWEDVVHFEFENVRAIRTPEWKYIERIHESPNELYDLRNDPGERLNLYGQERVAAVQNGLRQQLHSFFDRYADPKWDLWKSGKSKSGLITGRLFGLQDLSEGAAPGIR
jgi:arylsulfatase A-like enzyme